MIDGADPNFRLDATTRARIAPQFDGDAVERLLQHLDAPSRPFVLDEFLLPQFREHGPGPNEWRTLTGFSDPVLTELLAEVWQPFWDAQPDQMLDMNTPYPGQALAQQRRRDRR